MFPLKHLARKELRIEHTGYKADTHDVWLMAIDPILGQESLIPW